MYDFLHVSLVLLERKKCEFIDFVTSFNLKNKFGRFFFVFCMQNENSSVILLYHKCALGLTKLCFLTAKKEKKIIRKLKTYNGLHSFSILYTIYCNIEKMESCLELLKMNNKVSWFHMLSWY